MTTPPEFKLICPFDGGRLIATLEYVPGSYSEHRNWVGFECDSCSAEWSVSGEVTMRGPEPEDEQVTISAKELHRLRRDSEWLGYLESAGVDNWSGYSHAYDLRREARRAKMGDPT